MLSKIPHQLLSSLSKLQVLRMLDCTSDFTRADEDSVLVGDAEALMKELLCSEYLKYSLLPSVLLVLSKHLCPPKSCSAVLNL